MRILRSCCVFMLAALMACGCAVPQYTVGYRTYPGTSCTSGSQTVSSWASAQSVTSTDPNYLGPATWSNVTNVNCAPNPFNCFTNLNQPNCSGTSSCRTPFLYASTTTFTIPSGATLGNLVFTFTRWQNTAGSDGATIQTQQVYVCAGGAYGSCISATTIGDRVAWNGSTSTTTETYTFPPGPFTVAQLNAGLNPGIELLTDANVANPDEIDAKTNGWSVTIYYAVC